MTIILMRKTDFLQGGKWGDFITNSRNNSSCEWDGRFRLGRAIYPNLVDSVGREGDRPSWVKSQTGIIHGI